MGYSAPELVNELSTGAHSCNSAAHLPPFSCRRTEAVVSRGAAASLQGVLAGRRFLTMHNEQGISVCPFTMSRADITPSRWIPPW